MQAVLTSGQRTTSANIWFRAMAISLVVHIISAGWLFSLAGRPISHSMQPVKIKVTVSEPKPAQAPPPKPIQKEKPKPQNLAPNALVTPNTPQTDTPVQGLTKDSLSDQGTMAAPVGNTLMKEDEGKRLEQVEALRGDMSAPARLIAQTLTAPPYTDEALDAVLEGSFIVDVFVNLDGSVRDLELRKKIGYGMDGRVLNAVRAAKFIPRKNKFGVFEEGWTELKFTLVIP
jgi:outer membrane biosynthesis protein TonB